MDVILLQDVDKVGSMGEQVKVKDGYARNYLFPRNMAIEATKGALKVLEQKKKKKERLEQKIKEEAEAFAGKLRDLSVTISVESGEEDKLFGSVTSEMISDQLASEGHQVDRKKIELEEPIKKLGVYNVPIRLHPEVNAEVRVWVVKK